MSLRSLASSALVQSPAAAGRNDGLAAAGAAGRFLAEAAAACIHKQSLRNGQKRRRTACVLTAGLGLVATFLGALFETGAGRVLEDAFLRGSFDRVGLSPCFAKKACIAVSIF